MDSSNIQQWKSQPVFGLRTHNATILYLQFLEFIQHIDDDLPTVT